MGTCRLPVLQDDFAIDQHHVDAFRLLNEPGLLSRKVVDGAHMAAANRIRIKYDDVRRKPRLQAAPTP